MSNVTVTDYQKAVQSCALVASILIQFDLPELLRAIAHAHSAASLIDPTLYREKAGAMDEDKALLEAALPLWEFGKKLEGMREGG